ncbi:MAG: helix-turn-helix transcriptional regulator [Mesorhizobium sp.]|nr:MAG: helix-turn-helix transcriptional regulator [Mesorhizobium sp.]RWL95361.1 MAG: helix-turn-helix transcriptional regulator [Mesorhizobium sp.]
MGKVDLARLHEVAARLGEAVVDPSRWPILIDEISRATNSRGAILLQSDVRTADVPGTESIRDFIDGYFANNLHTTDVRAKRGVPLLLSGRPVIRDQDLFRNEREMLADPLYAHCERNGLRWFAGVGFYSGSALWGLTVQRSNREGPFDDREIGALAMLPRFLTEAATLSRAVGQQALSQATNALQLVRKPALALDLFGNVIDMNSAAERLLGPHLHMRSRRLVIQDGVAAKELDRLILRMRCITDLTPLPAAPIIIRRESQRPVLVDILPVTGSARTPFVGARLMLLLTDLQDLRPPPRETLKRMFGLTDSEAQFAQAMATGLSIQEAADEFAIAVETACKRLKAVFAKTEVHRQGELVALLSRL